MMLTKQKVVLGCMMIMVCLLFYAAGAYNTAKSEVLLAERIVGHYLDQHVCYPKPTNEVNYYGNYTGTTRSPAINPTT